MPAISLLGTDTERQLNKAIQQQTPYLQERGIKKLNLN